MGLAAVDLISSQEVGILGKEFLEQSLRIVGLRFHLDQVAFTLQKKNAVSHPYAPCPRATTVH
jgi:hypothetical protein